MKRIFYIVATALLGVWACTKEADVTVLPAEEDSVYPEGAEVELVFSVPAPVQTKAGMASEPEIENLYVAVFSQTGALKEYRKAEPVDGYVSGNGEAYKKEYKVTLYLSNTERHLHFIANDPQNLSDSDRAKGEAALLQSIITEGTDAAYWQRLVLPDGVTAETFRGTADDHYDAATGKVTFTYTDAEGATQTNSWATETNAKGKLCYHTDDGLTVVEGNYIKVSGYKVTDGTGYMPSKEVEEAIADIPLVRNFVRVNVVEKGGSNTKENNFHPRGFALVNVPASGYVAPYDSKGFVEPYMNVATEELDRDYLRNTYGYVPSIPGSIDTTQPEEDAYVTVASGGYAFMYERPVPTDKPTCLLVYGNLDGYHDIRWFKIEIADDDGKYIPLYRDFTYTIQLGSISGSSGYASADEAYRHAAIGDVSNSTATQTLTQISDGKGTTLWVNEIEYTHIGEKISRTLVYKMTYTEGSTTQNLTDGLSLSVGTSGSPAVDATELTGSPLSGSTYVISYDADGTAGATTGTPDGQDGWYYVNVPLNATGGGMMKSEVTVAGPSGTGKEMSRTVTYRVMNKQPIKIEATALASEEKDETTTLTITLPSDLGYSLFPLVIKIEAEANNLTPADDETTSLPVAYGESSFSSGNGFYYLYTINYTDYFDAEAEDNPYSTVKTLKFKTITDHSEDDGTNATRINAVDQNEKYLVAGQCNLTTSDGYLSVTPATQTVLYNATNVTFHVNTADDTQWKIGDVAGVTFTPASGTGPADVVMTFGANSESTTRTYTATVTTLNLEANLSKTVTVIQRAVPQSPATFNVSALSSGSATSGDGYVTVTLGNFTTSGTSYIQMGSRTGNTTNQGTITIAPVSGMKITGITVTYSSTTYAGYDNTGRSVSTGTYTISSATGTWSGSSTSTVTITNGYSGNGGNRNFPRITNISVTYAVE